METGSPMTAPTAINVVKHLIYNDKLIGEIRAQPLTHIGGRASTGSSWLARLC